MAEKYPLDMLIKARKIREDNAQSEVNSAKRALQQLEDDIIKKKEEIEKYTIWCKEEELRKFLEIKNKVLNQGELERFKWSMSTLQVKAVQLEGDLLTLEGQVEPAKQLIVDKNVLLKEARSKKEKIEEHKEIWKEKQEKEAIRLEDLELEEFTGKKGESFIPNNENE